MATVAEHTPGPWLMVSRPSSIVGWPIVAPQAMGRVVCSLNYADPKAFGGAQPGDRAFNAESEANGRIIEIAPMTYAACAAIDGEAPASEPRDRPTVGFQPSSDPEIDDGNDVVAEAFQEGVARGLWLAAKIARDALANLPQPAQVQS